jgi:CRP/FNR family cyclic AMP-dependent transcriptional regulator
MAVKATAPVDAKSLLAKASKGRSIVKYQKDHIIFSQDEPADAVFYIQKGKVKITVVSPQRKRSLQFLVRTISLARVVLPDSRGGWGPSGP